jgi:hypothetical protein
MKHWHTLFLFIIGKLARQFANKLDSFQNFSVVDLLQKLKVHHKYLLGKYFHHFLTMKHLFEQKIIDSMQTLNTQ